MSHHVLRNSNGIIQIDHSMPPPSGDEHRLPWTLHELEQTQRLTTVFLLNVGEHLHEVIYSLIVVISSPEFPALCH